MAIKGAIIGDIIGSQYEFFKPPNFDYATAKLLTDKCQFTDDTIMSLATKFAIDHNNTFAKAYQLFGNKYPNASYGSRFAEWISEHETEPYGSFGNGSAMRVSYIADYYESREEAIKYARESAECTHNHPEGIKGAVVTAECAWLAKKCRISKDDLLQFAIEQYPKGIYQYSPAFSLEEIRKGYRWNETCQGSVPVAIRCVYEANSYTEFIRNVLSLPCDTDTICAIGGCIAEELFDNSQDKIMRLKDSILKKYLDGYLLGVLNETEQ